MDMTLDSVVNENYGRSSTTLEEKILEENPHLFGQDLVLRAGEKLKLPDVESSGLAEEVPRVWS